MINNKKRNNKIKIEKFLKKFPIIFLLQHTNFTQNDWFDLRQKLQDISNAQDQSLSTSSSIEILNVKNNLVKKSVESIPFNHNLLDSLLQGPNFLIGCQNDTELSKIWRCINSNSKLLFMSCLYKEQLFTHLDFEVLLKTNSSIYQNLLSHLDKKTEIYQVLQNSLMLYPLLEVQTNLLQVLSLIKRKLPSN